MKGILDWLWEKFTELLVEAGTSREPDDEDLYAGFVVVV